MNRTMHRLEGHLRALSATGTADLNPAASRQDILDAEAAMGCSFPRWMREYYLCFNGEVPDHLGNGRTPGRPPLFPHRARWLSLKRTVASWKFDRELQARFDPVPVRSADAEWFGQYEHLRLATHSFNPKWIPVGQNNSGTRIYVDLDPGPTGVFGQLLACPTEGISDDEAIFAESLPAYFEHVCECIESGQVVGKPGEWVDGATGERVDSLVSLGRRGYEPRPQAF